MNLSSHARRRYWIGPLTAVAVAIAGCGASSTDSVAQSPEGDAAGVVSTVFASTSSEASKRLQCASPYVAKIAGHPEDAEGLTTEEKQALAKQTPQSIAARFAEKHPKSLSYGKMKSRADLSKTQVAYDGTDQAYAKRASVEIRTEAGEITAVVLVVRDNLGNWRFNSSVACGATPSSTEQPTPPAELLVPPRARE